MTIFRTILLKKNDCYKKGAKLVNPNGIVVHSTGANNPNLKRYVQPDDGNLGYNQFRNSWNEPGIAKCVHFMIGQDKTGVVRIYKTLPLDMKCWGCGSGRLGSWNNTRFQFEICEDSLESEAYFEAAMDKSIKLCSYLCRTYGISYTAIQSHAEAYKEGYGTQHADIDHWLKKFNKDMNWYRQQVKKQIEADSKTKYKVLKATNLRPAHNFCCEPKLSVPAGKTVTYKDKKYSDGKRTWIFVKYGNNTGWMSMGNNGDRLEKI